MKNYEAQAKHHQKLIKQGWIKKQFWIPKELDIELTSLKRTLLNNWRETHAKEF